MKTAEEEEEEAAKRRKTWGREKKASVSAGALG